MAAFRDLVKVWDDDDGIWFEFEAKAHGPYTSEVEAERTLAKLVRRGSRKGLISSAAEKLEYNGWFGPAQDLREGVPPSEVIKCLEDFTPEQDELDRAIPILCDLEVALKS
jgi:hypothetical protein